MRDHALLTMGSVVSRGSVLWCGIVKVKNHKPCSAVSRQRSIAVRKSFARRVRMMGVQMGHAYGLTQRSVPLM